MIEEAHQFWDIFGQLANSLVFILSGIVMGQFLYDEQISLEDGYLGWPDVLNVIIL